MTRFNVLRVAIAFPLVGLLAWFWFDTAPAQRRREGIVRHLQDGSIGTLTAAERERFNRVLMFAVARVAINKPIRVNVAPAIGSLNVYTTTPAAEETTQCGSGNAVYDSALDAIFVDVSLVRIDVLEPARNTIWGATLGFHDVYLCLIILHELGHRELHRHTLWSFDIPGAARDRATLRREKEADTFAVQHFAALSPANLSALLGPNSVQPVLWINVDPSKVAPDQIALYNLAASMRLMTTIAAAWESPYSAFYSNETHPLFVDRALGILEPALESAVAGADVKRELAISIEDLTRFKEALDHHPLELQLNAEIRDACINNRTLTLLDKWGNVYSLDLRGAKPSSETAELSPDASGPADKHWVAVWEAAGDTVVIDRDGRLYTCQQGVLAADAPLQASFDALGRCTQVDRAGVCSSNSGDLTVVLFAANAGAASTSAQRIAVFRGSSLLRIADVGTAFATIEKQTRARHIVLALNCVRDNEVYVEVYDWDKFLGMASLKTSMLADPAFFPLSVDGYQKSSVTSASRLFVTTSGRTPRFWLLTTYQLDPQQHVAHGCYLWGLRRDQSPELVNQSRGAFRDLSFSKAVGFHGISTTEPFFSIVDAKPSGPSDIVFSIDQDSVYSLRLNRAPEPCLARLFHPGRMLLATGGGRDVFLFSPKESKRGFAFQLEVMD
jgi:hypothetical protein